ncbi:MAG: hypothetical protein WC333_00710 [Dehalococcoidia bacterium]|jgi:DNA repair exonuclease SbcCD ATPase subunit
MKKSKKVKKQEKKLLKKQAKPKKKLDKLQRKLDKLYSKSEMKYIKLQRKLNESQSENKSKIPEKDKNLIRLANGSTVKNPVKSTPVKKSTFVKDLEKKKKKTQKKFNKIRKIVEKSFPDLEEKGMNGLIDSLANSVRLNKTFILSEEKTRKDWEERYINELFTEFKQLIEKYNKTYAFKADDLQLKIEQRQRELNLLTTEVKTLEKRKTELEKTVAG